MSRYRVSGLLLVAASVFLAPGGFAGDEPATGRITGVVLLDQGAPMAGGKLVVFRKDSGPPPYPSKYLRPPDEQVDIPDDGRFAIELPEGSYYLSAIKKAHEDPLGPPVTGDYVFPGPSSLQAGQTLYDVKSGETVDIGTVEAQLYDKATLPAPEHVTAIEGTIRDKDGKPVRGAVVFAFVSPTAVGKPSFVSERTGPDGTYVLRVGEGGTYYVKSRTSLRGGHPEEGEIVGVYGNETPRGVSLKTGETVAGVDIEGRVFTTRRKDPSKKGRF